MGANQSSGTMKAVVRAEGTWVMNAEWPLPPAPKADEVIIRVRGAGINPVDYKVPKMLYGSIVGLDVAGVIEKVAEGNVTHDFKVGDAVYGRAAGSLAEFATCKAGKIARKPEELSFAQAAAMNVAYLTGLQALTTHGGLKEGGRVLIIGASGGTGTAGIQIAKALKAGEIVAVCSAKNEQLVRNLGATKMIDYKTTKFVDVYGEAKEEEKFDVVYDCASYSGAGENYVQASHRVLKRGPPAGQYVPINGSKTMWARAQMNMQPANTHLFICKGNTKDLNTISKLVSEEGLRPVISKTLPFTKKDVQAGLEHLKGRRTVGKIVFDMSLGSDSAGEEVKAQEPEEEVKTKNVADAEDQPAEQVKSQEPAEDVKTKNVADAEDQPASDAQGKPTTDLPGDDAKVSPVDKVEKLPAEEVKSEPAKDAPTMNSADAEKQLKPAEDIKTENAAEAKEQPDAGTEEKPISDSPGDKAEKPATES